MAEGLRSSVGVAATPFTKGPYVWDQALSFGGTTTSTAVQDSTNGKRLFGSYLYSTATGGDQRAAYFRLWSAGNGTSVSGEAVRAYHSCTGITGPVHGLHASVAYSTSMYCNNEAIAVRGTIEIPNSAVSKGEYAGLQSEFYTNGASASIGGTAKIAFIRCIATGSEGTGAAAIAGSVFLFDFSNMSGTQYLSAGSGKFINTDITTWTKVGGIPFIYPDGTTKYIPVCSD